MRTIKLGNDNVFPIVDPDSGIYIIEMRYEVRRVVPNTTVIVDSYYIINHYLITKVNEINKYKIVEISCDISDDSDIEVKIFDNRFTGFKPDKQSCIKFLEETFSRRYWLVLLNFENISEFCKYERKRQAKGGYHEINTN